MNETEQLKALLSVCVDVIDHMSGTLTRHGIYDGQRTAAEIVGKVRALVGEPDVLPHVSGSTCPRCSGPLSSLRSQRVKICTDCKRKFENELKPGQKPLL